MHKPPDPLDTLLDRWSELPKPSPRLQANVWQQIATGEGDRQAGWRDMLERLLWRPAMAAGFVAACALLGLLLAEMKVSRLQQERSAQLARSYLLLIDPLLNEPSGNHRS